MTSNKFLLTDAEWRTIEPLLPRQISAGRRRKNDRLVASAIVFAMRTGCPFQRLPPAFGNSNTVQTRFYRWDADGTVAKILAELGIKPAAPHLARWAGGQLQFMLARGYTPWWNLDRDRAQLAEIERLRDAG